MSCGSTQRFYPKTEHSLGYRHPERPSYISDGGCLRNYTQAVVSRQPEGTVSPLLLGRGGLPGKSAARRCISIRKQSTLTRDPLVGVCLAGAG